MLPLLLLLGCATTPLPEDADGDGVADSIDCGPEDPSIKGANEQGDGTTSVYIDADNDGYGLKGSEALWVCSNNIPTGYVTNADDCDDENADVNPNAQEVSDDGVDNDCADGDYHEPIQTAYTDVDGDGYGDPDTGASYTESEIEESAGLLVDNGDDCDDSDASVNPGADEVCDGVDNNCDGEVDENTATDAVTWHEDADGDGYGNSENTSLSCDQPEGFVDNTNDCDDTDSDINPAVAEISYDGIDQDCDGYDLTDVDGDGHDALEVGGDDPDDTDATIYPGAEEIPYDGIDQDGDGYDLTDVDEDGHDALEVGGDDPDDTDATIYPGAEEIPYDGIDQDGDGYDLTDVDGDGYDSSAVGGLDFDDDDASINPDAEEIPYDGIDQDCDGDDLTDVDGDGFDSYEVGGLDLNDNDAAINPEATEVCDGVDNNCDGVIDEDTAADAPTWYIDADGDNYGVTDSSTQACEAPEGYAAPSTDCDDEDASLNPGVEETNDGIDNNCDDVIDNELYLATDEAIQTITGTGAKQKLGDGINSLASFGDLDGDGVDDFVVGVPYYSTNMGEACVIPGGGSGEQTLAEASDFCFTGETAKSYTGRSVANLGNSLDGESTLGISSFETDTVYLMGMADIPTDGSSISLSYASDRMSGESGSYFGYRLSAGDLDGDGVDDVVVGAPGDNSGDGSVHLFLGPVSGELSDSDADTTLAGDASSEQGAAVFLNADLDGDGYNDLVSSEDYYGSDSQGRAIVSFGNGSGSLTQDVTIDGGSADDNFATGFAAIENTGDLPYLVAGNVNASTDGYNHNGAAYIFDAINGSATSLNVSDALQTLSGDSDDVSCGNIDVGHLQSDGINNDLIIGCNYQDTDLLRAGVAYTLDNDSLLNSSTLTLGITQTSASLYAGDSTKDDAASSLLWADTTGDGLDDVVIGVPGFDSASTDIGGLLVIPNHRSE